MVSSENRGSQEELNEKYGGWEIGLPSAEELAPLNRTIITPILACAFSINEEKYRQKRSEADAERAAQATLDNLYESIRMSSSKSVDLIQSYQTFSMVSERNTRDQPLVSQNREPPARMASIVESDTGDRPDDSSHGNHGSPRGYRLSGRLFSHSSDARMKLDESSGRRLSGPQRTGSRNLDYGSWQRFVEEATGQPARQDEKRSEDLEKEEDKAVSKKDNSVDVAAIESDKDGHDRFSKQREIEAHPVPKSTGRDSTEDADEKRSKSGSPSQEQRGKKARVSSSDEDEKNDNKGHGETMNKRDNFPQNWMEGSDTMADDGTKTVKRPRLVWTPQLHRRFVDAVSHLGLKNAVPKTIMQLMNVSGLTRENVASHLQKYRLYLKRMEQGNSSDGPMSSEQLFASTPIPANLTNQSGSSQRFYQQPREDISPHPTPLPPSHMYLGQYPYAVPPPQNYEGYSVFNHPMSTGQLMHKLSHQERELGTELAEESREQWERSGGRDRMPSSPPSTVLSLFPGGSR